MKRKYADKNGATIIFAIAVFLVATVISISIVGAALNSAKAAARHNKNQQANLAVSSAASYVRKLFDGCSYTYVDGTGEYMVSFADTELGNNEIENNMKNNFKTFIEAHIDTINDDSLKWDINSSLRETDPITEESYDPLKVHLEIKLNEKNVDNELKVVVYDGDTTKDSICSVVMVFGGTEAPHTPGANIYDYTFNYSAIEN